MATGFGIGPDGQGNGTTPADIQAITAAEYATAGIIKGAEVKPTTGMSYSISAGAAVIRLAENAMIRVPVAAQSVPTSPAPQVGSRTDIVYVKQNLTASDGSNAVIVGVGTSLPANSVEIARFLIPAGATATNQASPTGNRIYAQLTGASRNVLSTFRDVDAAAHKPGEVITRASSSFALPTDRLVEFRLTGVFAADNWNTRTTSAPFGHWGTVKVKLYVDEKIQGTWELYYDSFNRPAFISHLIEMTPGVHTVKYTVESAYTPSGMPGAWKVIAGTAEQYPGVRFHVIDRGVAVV